MRFEVSQGGTNEVNEDKHGTRIISAKDKGSSNNEGRSHVKRPAGNSDMADHDVLEVCHYCLVSRTLLAVAQCVWGFDPVWLAGDEGC